MFEFFKKLFSRNDLTADHTPTTASSHSDEKESADKTHGAGKTSFLTKPCKTCGKPITYNPSWKRIPNYCSDCYKKHKASQKSKQGTVTITCKNCGKTVTLPSNVQHWPDLCQECRSKLPSQQITRKCRGCGKEFSFPSKLRHWPNYCRECQAKRKKKPQKA